MKTHLLFLALAAFLSVRGLSAEPSRAEATAREQAEGFERDGDWQQAGVQWEGAWRVAERAGDFGRAIEHMTRAVSAWRQVPGAVARDRQAFALGVASKLEIMQGRLTDARAHNVAALELIAARIRETSGWNPVAGHVPTEKVPMALMESWARAQRDTANWLDAQGRTLQAIELLSGVDKSARALAPGGQVTGFYHRKVVASRAEMLKFLGYTERALSDYRMLVETHRAGDAEPEFSNRVNLAYFSAEFFGPKAEYLDVVREAFREMEAAGRVDRGVRRLLAKMAYAYGETGANIKDLAEVIAEARAAGADLEAMYAQRDLARIQMQTGHREGVEKKFLEALGEVRQRGVKRGEPSLYREYGLFLLADGRPAEGLKMLHEAVRMTRAFGWTQHLPWLLSKVAGAQARLGDLHGLGQTLAELDVLLARGGLTPEREFLAHCARAHTLLLLGRAPEAKDAVARAKAVAEGAGLNDYQRFALGWTKDVKPVERLAPAAVAARQGVLDLQPVAVIATAPIGVGAVGRFRLSNATGQSVDGTLTFTGKYITARMDEAAGIVTVVAGESDGGGSAVLPVRVEGGGEISILIQAVAGVRPAGVGIVWRSQGVEARAQCAIRAESSEADGMPGSTVSNTSLAFENLFYAVHLHHVVRADGAVRSFRVQPSRPCRVEVFDARTGALLAVDSDGDGEFRSRGDSVGADANADGYPDLPTDGASGVGEIEVLVFPLPGAGSEARDTRIVVQVKREDGWRSVAHDTLKPPRRNR